MALYTAAPSLELMESLQEDIVEERPTTNIITCPIKPMGYVINKLAEYQKRRELVS